MDTLNTIITNFNTLAHAKVDWSPAAGPIWLAGMVVIAVALGIAAAVQEARSTR